MNDNVVEQLQVHNETLGKILAVLESKPSKIMQMIQNIGVIAGALAILTVIGQIIVWVFGG